MEYQLSYFKSWKMMLWKCCTQYASKFGKLSSGHRTGKGQFSSQCQKKANRELPDVQAGFRKGRRTRYQITNIHWIIEKAREFQKITYFCFIDYARAFECMDHNKLWKFLKRWENQATLLASWETCIQVRKQQLELDMEQQIGSKWKGVCQDSILSPCLCNLYA